MTTASMIAQHLLDEGATSLSDASSDLKFELTRAYLFGIDWDREITFNLREFRDAMKLGNSCESVVMDEVYVWAEMEYGHAIAFELAALREESVRDIDAAIHEIKLRSVVA